MNLNSITFKQNIIKAKVKTLTASRLRLRRKMAETKLSIQYIKNNLQQLKEVTVFII